MPRPKLPDEIRRNIRIGFNVNQLEKKKLDEAFENSDFVCFGDIIRDRVLQNGNSELSADTIACE